MLLTVTAGIAMLKGCNWGRLLYVVWSGFGMLFGLATSPMKMAMVPGIVVYLLFCFLLYRPAATAYFQPAEPADDAPGM